VANLCLIQIEISVFPFEIRELLFEFGISDLYRVKILRLLILQRIGKWVT